ncbi:putative short chain dehydrogenase/oxidoreductase [Elaphomyces granulatus]
MLWSYLQRATRSRPLRTTYAITRTTSTTASYIQTKSPPVGDANHPQRFGEFNLEDRVIAVTGGGRGLGLAMAEALMEAGAKVFCMDRLESPDPEFEAARDGAKSDSGGSLHYLRIDVRDSIAAESGRLDGMICAAAVNHVQSAIEHSQSAMDEVMHINYNGVFNSATAAAKQMFHYKSPGSILLVASMSGLIANKGMTSPVHGIRVNSLCPGHIITPMVEQVFEKTPAARDSWESENMLGRLAAPEEFRGVALFALSDASSFMTGSCLLVDGGHTAW